jgi:prepilin-type N-terminal cleavage/methylation domain-containing protein
MTRFQRGYTLTELLIVIATIAVMAAILFPVFSDVSIRNAAKNADKHNTRKISAAILEYAEDNDGKFPRAGYDCRGHNDNLPGDDTIFAPGQQNQCGGDAWQDAIGPYVKKADLFLAPDDKSQVGDGPWGGGTGTSFNTTDGNLSFVINDLLSHAMPSKAGGYADPASVSPQSDGLRVSDVATPSQCLLIAEGHSGWDKASAGDAHPVLTDWTGSTDIQNKWHHEYTVTQNFTPFIASTGYDGSKFIRIGLPFRDHGANVAYTDGHQAFISVEDSNGNPLLCHTLPWTKAMDPQQRNSHLDSCNDPSNPLPAGWTNPNWF